jgi:hypothetical protein
MLNNFFEMMKFFPRHGKVLRKKTVFRFRLDSFIKKEKLVLKEKKQLKSSILGWLARLIGAPFTSNARYK